MNKSEFEYIRSLVYNQTSILLEPSDAHMVELRLSPLINGGGFSSLDQFMAFLRSDPGAGDIRKKVIESLLNHETSFYRDLSLFDTLKMSVLPQLISLRGRDSKLRIWSAACSTGQEPYSLAMLIRENFPFLVFNGLLEFWASDYSHSTLEYARAGRYSQLEINRGLPADYMIKYFSQEGVEWQIASKIRDMINFKQVNLVEPWPSDFPKMDIILMRNILIYHNIDVKKEVLDKVRRFIMPDGYLILGSAETTVNIHEAFEPVCFSSCVCYRLRPAFQ